MHISWNSSDILSFFERYSFISSEQLETVKSKQWTSTHMNQNIIRVLNDLKVRKEEQRNEIISDWNEIVVKQLTPTYVLHRKQSIVREAVPVREPLLYSNDEDKQFSSSKKTAQNIYSSLDVNEDENDDVISDIYFYEMDEINQEEDSEEMKKNPSSLSSSLHQLSTNPTSVNVASTSGKSISGLLKRNDDIIQPSLSGPLAQAKTNVIPPSHDLLDTIEELQKVIEIINDEKFELRNQVESLTEEVHEQKKLLHLSTEEIKEMQRENDQLNDENMKLTDNLMKLREKYQKLMTIQKRATTILKNNSPAFNRLGPKKIETLHETNNDEEEDDDGSIKHAESSETAELITMEEDLMMMMVPDVFEEPQNSIGNEPRQSQTASVSKLSQVTESKRRVSEVYMIDQDIQTEVIALPSEVKMIQTDPIPSPSKVKMATQEIQTDPVVTIPPPQTPQPPQTSSPASRNPMRQTAIGVSNGLNEDFLLKLRMEQMLKKPLTKDSEVQTDPIHNDYIRRSMIVAIGTNNNPATSNQKAIGTPSSSSMKNMTPFTPTSSGKMESHFRKRSQTDIVTTPTPFLGSSSGKFHSARTFGSTDDNDPSNKGSSNGQDYLIPPDISATALETFDIKTLRKQFLMDREKISNLTKEKDLIIQFYDLEITNLKSQLIDEESNLLHEKERSSKVIAEHISKIKEISRINERKQSEIESLKLQIANLSDTIQQQQSSQKGGELDSPSSPRSAKRKEGEEESQKGHLKTLHSIHNPNASFSSPPATANNSIITSPIPSATSNKAQASPSAVVGGTNNRKHLINTRHRKIVSSSRHNSTAATTTTNNNNMNSPIPSTPDNKKPSDLMVSSIALGINPSTNNLPVTGGDGAASTYEEKIHQFEKEKNDLKQINEEIIQQNNSFKEIISSLKEKNSLLENDNCQLLEKLKMMEMKMKLQGISLLDGDHDGFPRAAGHILELSEITDNQYPYQSSSSPKRKNDKDNNIVNANNQQNEPKEVYYFKYDGYGHYPQSAAGIDSDENDDVGIIDYDQDEYYYHRSNQNHQNPTGNFLSSSLSPPPIPAAALELSMDNDLPPPNQHLHRQLHDSSPFHVTAEGEFYDPLSAEEEEEGGEGEELIKNDSFYLTQEKWIKKESVYLANIHYLLELLQDVSSSYQELIAQLNHQQSNNNTNNGGPLHHHPDDNGPESERPPPSIFPSHHPNQSNRPPSKQQIQYQHFLQQRSDSKKEFLSRLVEANHSFLQRQQQKLIQQKRFLSQQQMKERNQNLQGHSGPDLVKDHYYQFATANNNDNQHHYQEFSPRSGITAPTTTSASSKRPIPHHQEALKRTSQLPKKRVIPVPYITFVRPKSANTTTINRGDNERYEFFDERDLDLIHTFIPRNHYISPSSQQQQQQQNSTSPRPHSAGITSSDPLGGGGGGGNNSNNPSRSSSPTRPRRPKSANSTRSGGSPSRASKQSVAGSASSRPSSANTTGGGGGGSHGTRSHPHFHNHPARKIVGYDFPVRDLLQQIGQHFSGI